MIALKMVSQMLVVGCVFVLTACDRDMATPPRDITAASSLALTSGRTVARLRASYPRRSASEVGTRMHAVANLVLAGRGTPDIGVFRQAATNAAAEHRDVWHLDGSNTPLGNLSVAYHPKFDNLVVQDESLLAALPALDSAGAVPDPDVGEVAARNLAVKTIAQLASGGLLNSEDFDPATAETGHRKVAGGRSDETVVERILEYRFTFMRRINGIPFANAGLRIGVHRSGRLSGIRLGGAEVATVRELGAEYPQSGTGSLFAPGLTQTAASQRFRREFQDTKLWKSARMYVMHDNVESEIIEPHETFLFSRIARSVSTGDISYGVARRVGYPIAAIDSPLVSYEASSTAPTVLPDSRRQ